MSTPKSTLNVAVVGRRLFNELPQQLVTQNHGRIIAIDVDSQKYFLADSVVEALKAAKVANARSRLFVARVGVGPVYRYRR